MEIFSYRKLSQHAFCGQILRRDRQGTRKAGGDWQQRHVPCRNAGVDGFAVSHAGLIASSALTH